MAERIIRQLVDDIDGTDITDGGLTVEFAVRGIDYRLDLSKDNVSKFEEAIGPYIEAAVKASKNGGPSSKPTRRKESAAAIAEAPKAGGRSRRKPAGKVSSPRSRTRKSRQTKASTTPSKERSAEIRAWATENGHQVSARGRISAEILEAFKAAQTESGT